MQTMTNKCCLDQPSAWEVTWLACLTGGLKKCYPQFPYYVNQSEFQSIGGGNRGGRGDCNKMFSTTSIIWKNNKATITHATHQLCVTVAAVERLCSASFPEKHFLYRVGKGVIVYTINQASVIAVSCTLSSPKKSYKQRLLMCFHPLMVNRFDLDVILKIEMKEDTSSQQVTKGAFLSGIKTRK